MKRFARWAMEHKRPFRLLCMSSFAVGVVLAWWGRGAAHWAFTGAMILLNGGLATLMLVLWRRIDALDEFERHITHALNDSYCGTRMWALGYRFFATRDIIEMNRWLDDHDLTRTPVDDMPPKVKELHAIVQRL